MVPGSPLEPISPSVRIWPDNDGFDKAMPGALTELDYALTTLHCNERKAGFKIAQMAPSPHEDSIAIRASGLPNSRGGLDAQPVAGTNVFSS